MSDEVIRYGAGGIPYVKKSPAPKKEEVQDPVFVNLRHTDQKGWVANDGRSLVA